ncbi:unnamed protein product [Mytilus coruscus]|uniref:WSC domain-containing protein n=1 Tax=Mytilus coruscus TaxID=42192 RepID=A0A6J8E1H0_MYTCO|nr:unnamed protein product [Mytilus coruscus]
MAETTTLTYCVFILYNAFVLANVQHHELHHVKTTWMTHLGCFSVKSLKDTTTVQLTNIANNQPKICSRQCGKWSFFAVLERKCFCFNIGTFQNLIESVSNRCYKKCPHNTDNMYCGSEDMYYANVYRREAGLPLDVINQNLDCLTVIRQENRTDLKQMSCGQAFPFICNNKPVEENYTFKKAKLYCENSQSRLMTFNENLPKNAVNNVHYWVATFRQLIYRHEESTVHPPTTTGPILVNSTQDIYTQQSTTTRERTLELVNMTTERTTRTSANLPTKISTFFAKEESVTQSGTMSKSMKSEEHHET